MWELPCPLVPTTATRTVSFGPPKALDANVAPAAAAELITKCLRFIEKEFSGSGVAIT
jgi:hypothetical protein